MTHETKPSSKRAEDRCAANAVSANGVPVTGKLYDIAARGGVAVRLETGEVLTVMNPSGHQVCDLWAFAAGDMNEFLSMAHVHTSLGSIFPKAGDGLVSNMRRVLLTLTEDTSPGVHDTLIASCDQARYRELGCIDYHDNCADNLRFALKAIGLHAPLVPAPFNLWMNVPIRPDGSTQFAPPVSRPGDRMSFRAEAETIAVMSACPQDLTPVNGVGTAPDRLQFRVDGP